MATVLEDYVLSLVRPEAEQDIGPPPSELLSRLREMAVPLETAAPGTGIDDLRPLSSVVEAARVVGLGEATHGTAEFFTLKHRLFEFLVEEHAFTTFALETGFAETLPTCDYVLGADNRDEAVAALPDSWSTPELADLIEWMRTRNSSGQHPKLTFYGFDMQSPTAPVLQAMAVARRVDPAAARLEPDLAPLASAFGSEHYRALPPDARARVRNALETLTALLQTARDEAAPDSSGSRELARAYVLACSAQRAESYAFLPTQRGRDEAMTATVFDVLEMDGAQSKVALWAHNAHTQRGELIELIGGGRVPTMGELLHRRLGRSYVRISFAFDRGSFRARHLLNEPTDTFTVGPATPYSIDGAFAAVGLELAAFPLQGLADEGPAADWLAARPGARCVSGATTDYLAERSYVRADPRVSADVFMFVAETTGSRKSPSAATTAVPPDPRPDMAGDSEPNLEFAIDGAGQPWGWLASPAPSASLHVQPPTAGASVVLALRRDDGIEGFAAATHPVAAPGSGARTAVVRAELAAEVSGWPAGAHLTLRYDTTASIDEQLLNPPFAYAPVFPLTASEWQQVEARLALPEGVSTVQIGLALVGAGTVRMRGVSFDVQ